MSIPVARTCTELSTGEAEQLSVYRSVPAYVLLGDPGAGKTTEFRTERRRLGDVAAYVKARDFVRLDLDSHPEWRDRTLFIDGLDEMRAGATDARIPLDEIRNRLDRLGRPNFRISCREADWLGPNDRQSLEAVSPDSTIRVLLLDQLSLQAIRELLAEAIGVDNAEAFKDEAECRGLGAMLRNPQTLKLLTKAVGPGGTWPDSRLETLELACQEMAAEYNDEHRHAGRRRPTEVILDAAGHLCALLMLCGFEGYALASGGLAADSGAKGLLPLDDFGDTSLVPSREVLKAALATNLFRPEGETGRVPSHRLIAEFLAGRFLAELIERGLPARRVVALMTGPSDGRVVTALRGLSAWLAAHPGGARRQLIDADPVGVGLYGDIWGFTLHDRERLLRSLVEFAGQGPLFGHAWQDDRALGYGDDTARAFRSLASADMLESIRRVLRTPVGQPQRYRTTAFMLEVLSEAEESQKESLIPLVPGLVTILRDPDGPPWVTANALDAYVHIAPSDKETDETLAALLNEVQEGSIPDRHDQIRWTLLEQLYPHVIRPADVWRYAVPPHRQRVIGSLGAFWDGTILKESPDGYIAELLDSLCRDADLLIPALRDAYLDDLPIQLLARGLEGSGDVLGTEHLLDWLGIAGRMQAARHLREAEASLVRRWLESRPQVQKAVFLAWMRRQLMHKPDRPHRHWACDALHGSNLPGDFGLWCLDQAMEREDREPDLARELLDQVYFGLPDPSINEGLSLAVIRERIDSGTLADHLGKLCERRSNRAEENRWHEEMEQRREQREEEEGQRQEGWKEGLRSQLGDLRSNRFFAPDLHTLARAYLGMFSNVDQEVSPRQRIHKFIGGDEDLVDAVMAAIRGAVYRDDVPTVEETVSLHSESKHSWLAYPVLASLRLLDDEDPGRLDRLDEDRKRKALALHHCLLTNETAARWHDRWFQQDPEMVLEVLYRCAVPALRAGQEIVPCLNALDGFADHDELVHDARLRVLDSLPTRGSNKQMGMFDGLLARAMQHPDRASLQELTSRKLSLKSTGVARRTRWLAVDALLSGPANLKPLKAYVGANEVRVRHLAEFLRRTSRRNEARQSVLAGVRDPGVLRDAIEILGPSFGPVRRGGWITLGMEMSELVSSLIEQLGTLAGDDTDRSFTELIDDPRMERWRDRLTEAHERHRVINRDASYRHPGIDEVQRTLGRGAPSNAADLVALLQDRLADISADVRGGNDNPWRNYWSDDRHRPPTEPKHEDSCRDALLADLKKRLPIEVDAAPEGRYAADNRADIRASCSRFNVPVEIKKNSHRDVWSAMRRQLIGKYTTDPATSGYGIYLVLWFGASVTKIPPDGDRPANPEALQQRLEQELTPVEARKISVIVMDVTKPGEPPR